jgi:hypothetical protein
MTQLRRPAQQYLLVDAGLPGAGVHITQLRSLLLGISCGIIGGLGWIQPEQASRSGPALSLGRRGRRSRKKCHHGDRTEGHSKNAYVFNLVEVQHGDVSLSIDAPLKALAVRCRNTAKPLHIKVTGQLNRITHQSVFSHRNAITNMTGQLKVSMGLNITFTSTAS